MKLEKHTDERGTIEDLYVGKDFSVTRITFKKGAVRGNHYHKKTIQYDLVVSGKLNFVCKAEKFKLYGDDVMFIETGVVESGMVKIHEPNKGHAYKALKDSEMISICIGKRIGKNYSKDTYKLKTPLI